MWQKCLIKDSIFQTLILKEVWGWVDNPQMQTIYAGENTRKVKFFIINCQHPGEPAPIGLAEHDILWLLRDESDVRQDQPPLISATQWLSPAWPGL